VNIHGHTNSRRDIMIAETLSSVAGLFRSFLIGFFIKKIIKILLFAFGSIDVIAISSDED
jgi:hypothetical protein